MKKLSYLQVQYFYALKNQLVAEHTRAKRMQAFSNAAALSSGAKVLDLGGTPDIWRHVDERLDITILNRPEYIEKVEDSRHRFRYIAGDARSVDQFDDHSFDLVFSNSVIEHVGEKDSQRIFASEVRRLGRAYWIQTPCKWFPIEPHCGMPFWWSYPPTLRNYCLAKWRKTMPAFADMVAETRPLPRSWLESLFPEAEIHTEFFFGLPKSYSAFHFG